MPIPDKMFQKLHFGDKQNIKNTILLNHENITECAQNIHCEPGHKQRDGDATDWWLQQQSNGAAFSIWLTVSVSVLQDVAKMKRLV